MISEEIGAKAMFEYPNTGSQWNLESYLNEHPSVRVSVFDRLSRVPNRSSSSFFNRIKRMLFD